MPVKDQTVLPFLLLTTFPCSTRDLVSLHRHIEYQYLQSGRNQTNRFFRFKTATKQQQLRAFATHDNAKHFRLWVWELRQRKHFVKFIPFLCDFNGSIFWSLPLVCRWVSSPRDVSPIYLSTFRNHSWSGKTTWMPSKYTGGLLSWSLRLGAAKRSKTVYCVHGEPRCYATALKMRCVLCCESLVAGSSVVMGGGGGGKGIM